MLRGSFWNGLSFLLPQVYVLIVSVAAARALGPVGMGQQSFISFVAISASQFFSAGMPSSLQRYVSDSMGRGRPDAVPSLLSWSVRIISISALAGGAVLVLVGFSRPEQRPAWLLASLVTALGVLHTVPTAFLAGLQRWREAATAGLVSGSVGTVATVAVLWAGGGITGMFAVEAMTAIINLAWTGHLAERAVKSAAPSAGPSDDLHRPILTYASIIWLGLVVSLIVWQRSEFFFLDRYATATEIALYSVPFAFVLAIKKLPDALANTITPAFSTLYGAEELGRIRSGYGRAMRFSLLASLPITTGMLAVGPTTLAVVYGSDYQGATPVLRILALGLPVLPLITLASALLNAVGRLAFALKVGGAAAVFNVALDVLLIGPHGARGAAVANLAAQLAGGIPLVAYAARWIGGVRFDVGALLRQALASLGAGSVGLMATSALGGASGLLVGISGGVLVFTVMLVLLRAIPADDGRWLEGMVGPRLGRLVSRMTHPAAHMENGVG